MIKYQISHEVEAINQSGRWIGPWGLRVAHRLDLFLCQIESNHKSVRDGNRLIRCVVRGILTCW